MDQNQGADNDLQKAIDNISAPTNSVPADANANANTDPVFSDPVAAPSSVPEGDTGELGEPVGPFPMPPAAPPADPSTTPQVGIVTPGPEPIAPLDPISIPDLGVPTDTKPTESAPLTSDSSNPDSSADTPLGSSLTDSTSSDTASLTGSINSGTTNSDSVSSDSMNSDSTKPGDSKSDSTSSDPLEHAIKTGEDQHAAANKALNARQIKTAALRDLAPLLNHVHTDPEEKFKICCSIFEDLHDYSVLDQAYKAASEIKNEDTKAKSLLYLIESIDQM